jgi:hypothetical protein
MLHNAALVRLLLRVGSNTVKVPRWRATYSTAFTMSSTTFLASPKTIMVLSM